ncbi:uncharacterized protein LOC123593046 isoform X3 [Leopardus geoffroyi]|uniref:uncharacterized protein LOC123593046 isoform X3 n=1 Tax=Leopardus geoffroyi TaxID=46844 RepID=UPI001E25E1AE|nr:uncharacterized protein LOC123593046 isoform X3 [Leopardus geoffroyi]
MGEIVQSEGASQMSTALSLLLRFLASLTQGGPTALFLEGASSPSGMLRLCGSEFRSRRAGQTLHGVPRGAENEHISVFIHNWHIELLRCSVTWGNYHVNSQQRFLPSCSLRSGDGR